MGSITTKTKMIHTTCQCFTSNVISNLLCMCDISLYLKWTYFKVILRSLFIVWRSLCQPFLVRTLEVAVLIVTAYKVITILTKKSVCCVHSTVVVTTSALYSLIVEVLETCSFFTATAVVHVVWSSASSSSVEVVCVCFLTFHHGLIPTHKLKFIFMYSILGIWKEWFVEPLLDHEFYSNITEEVDEAWKEKHGKNVSDTVKDYLLTYLGEPLHQLIRYILSAYFKPYIW